jgi:hypothetical protein
MNDMFGWSVGRHSQLPGPDSIAYLIGSIVGGAVTGLAFGMVGAFLVSMGSPQRNVFRASFLILCVSGVALEMLGRVSPLPERRAQVPTRWLAWRSRKATAAAYGLAISSGVSVYLHHAVAYSLVAGIVLVGSAPAGALVGSVYGLTWGLAPAVAGHGPYWQSRRSGSFLRLVLGAIALLSVGCLTLLTGRGA